MGERPLIFLDIDGVLNCHNYDEACESSTINSDCVYRINRVLDATGAMIVISSAWRYMVHGGAMTLGGFGYMLRTHGVRCKDRIIGLTCIDEEIPERGQQIRQWLNIHGGDRPYVVIDDGGTEDGRWSDLGINAAGHPVVWTDGRVGLTWDDAAKAIGILAGAISHAS